MLATVRSRREMTKMALARIIKNAGSTLTQGVMANGKKGSANLMAGPVLANRSNTPSVGAQPVPSKPYKPPQAPSGSSLTGSYSMGKAAAVMDDLFGGPPANTGSRTKPVNVRAILNKQAAGLGDIFKSLGGGTAGLAGGGGAALGGMGAPKPKGPPPLNAQPPAGPPAGPQQAPATPPPQPNAGPQFNFPPPPAGMGGPISPSFVGGPPPEPTAPTISPPDTSILSGPKPPSGPVADVKAMMARPGAMDVMSAPRPQSAVAPRNRFQSRATQAGLINSNISNRGAGAAGGSLQNANQRASQPGGRGTQQIKLNSARDLHKVAARLKYTGRGQRIPMKRDPAEERAADQARLAEHAT